MPVIGIDLGTNYSRVALVEDGKVTVVRNKSGKRCTPSYVAFTDSRVLIGEPAKTRISGNWKNTVFGVKNILGRGCAEGMMYPQFLSSGFYCDYFEDMARIIVKFRRKTKIFVPEEITALLILHLKRLAEKHIGQKIKECVISVPNGFDDRMRQATKDAARIAGMRVLQLIDDTTAAALAYSVRKQNASKQNVFILDLGGGTLNASIVSMGTGSIDVLDSFGRLDCGGSMVEHEMAKFIIKYQNLCSAEHFSIDNSALYILENVCEQLKHRLGHGSKEKLDMQWICEHFKEPVTLTQAQLDEWTASLTDMVTGCLKWCTDTGYHIGEVVLIGGAARLPQMTRLLKNHFQGKPVHELMDLEELVVVGAAIRAGLITGDYVGIQLTERAMFNVDIIDPPFNIAKKNDVLPVTKLKIFTTTKAKIEIKQDGLCTNTFLIEMEQFAIGHEIRISCLFDSNKIANVTAFDMSARQELSVRKVGNLTYKELENMSYGLRSEISPPDVNEKPPGQSTEWKSIFDRLLTQQGQLVTIQTARNQELCNLTDTISTGMKSIRRVFDTLADEHCNESQDGSDDTVTVSNRESDQQDGSKELDE